MTTRPRLAAAVTTLRRQVNRAFPHRDKTSDGTIGDKRHASTQSDHNPDPAGWVRALDIDADLDDRPETSTYLAEQLRLAAKNGDKRIAYIIHAGKIASPRRNTHGAAWGWRKYTGVNPHLHHLHVSFTRHGDEDGTPFDVPLLKKTVKT